MSGVGWAWTHGAPATAVLWTLGLAWFAVCSGVLVRTDLREHRLSNRWTLRLALGGLAMMTGGALLAGRGDLALCSLLGGLGYTVAMLALHVLSRGGLGMGDVKLAGELGADLAMTGVVQKVSNLILNINLYLRDVHTGQLVAAASADMRGNTDESWSRATAYLVRNRLLAPNYGAPQAR